MNNKNVIKSLTVSGSKTSDKILLRLMYIAHKGLVSLPWTFDMICSLAVHTTPGKK